MIKSKPTAVRFVLGIILTDQFPETMSVIAVDHVRDFVNNNIIDDFVRSHDKFTIEAKAIGG